MSDVLIRKERISWGLVMRFMELNVWLCAGAAAFQGQKEVSIDGGPDAAGTVPNARIVPGTGSGSDVSARAGGNAASDRGRGDGVELPGIANLRPGGPSAGEQSVCTVDTFAGEESEEDATGSERGGGAVDEGPEGRRATIAVGAVAGSVAGPASEGRRGAGAGGERDPGGVAGVGVGVGQEAGVGGVGAVRQRRAGQPGVCGPKGSHIAGANARTRASGGGGASVGRELAGAEKGHRVGIHGGRLGIVLRM